MTGAGFAEGRPVFIVGCPRSGTTLVRRMLDSHPGISCGPETLFLSQMKAIEDQHWTRLARFGITRQDWRHHVRQLFVWLHLQHAQRRGKPRWADKSPGYALILDYLASMFPDCQVLHVVRHPRDVVDSYRRRWGARAALAANRDWPLHVGAARAFGARVGPDQYLEVRYEDLVGDPRATMAAVLEFLGEPWDPAVLVPSDAWPARSFGTGADPNGSVFTTSVGVGERPAARLLSLGVQLGSRRLMGELGYQ